MLGHLPYTSLDSLPKVDRHNYNNEAHSESESKASSRSASVSVVCGISKRSKTFNSPGRSVSLLYTIPCAIVDFLLKRTSAKLVSEKLIKYVYHCEFKRYRAFATLACEATNAKL